MITIQKGQRFSSDMEPELGLGIVTAIDPRTVTIHFRAGDCQRRYAMGSASLRRVSFQPGDTMKTRDGAQFTIEKVENRGGLLVYFGDGREIPEQDLCDTLSFTSAQDRLVNGIFDSNFLFDLRFKTVQINSRLRHSSVRGFLGGRIQLIPHQLYIAHVVSNRALPRVMLSDEVGLGKTIEACLILHRLLLTGRIGRVLILVPEPLVYQWFVELIRKFNLIFRIMDKAYYDSIQQSEPEANPFLKDQLCLCDIQFPITDESYRKQVFTAGWDMLVVDEAHHLTENSPSYELVKHISTATPGLMLLTATPEQLGQSGHFARLQLLDPDRYHDYNLFVQQQKMYKKMAQWTDRLVKNKPLTQNEQRSLNELLASHTDDKNSSKEKIMAELLDRYGPGRALFRNTRADKAGFPKRQVHLVPLPAGRNFIEQSIIEFHQDSNGNSEPILFNFSQDPRIIWLIELLKKLKREKVVLICSSKSKAIAVDHALQKHMRIHTALFHEDLTLLQRDRNAAWFARKDGASILICSEIGSEGRNFQFAHHLVLLDLPLDPEKLEQRIGRLDRIGQTGTIHLHIPFIKKSPQEILARWYHEGLDAFNQYIRGAFEIYQKLGSELRHIAIQNQDCTDFLTKTRHVSRGISRMIEKGRDKLLEMHSYDPLIADALIHEIAQQDQDRQLDRFVEVLFDQFGIQSDELSNHTLQINFGALNTPAFPVPPLPEENLIATFDRNTAIQQEHIEFLTWDHPMITGAMELMLASEKGNSCVALWPEADTNEILLHAIFILECVAPAKLHVDRFLQPMPVQAVVDHLLNDRSMVLADIHEKHLKIAPPSSLLQNVRVRELIPKMIARCQEYARHSAAALIQDGLNAMISKLQTEMDRLLYLKKINPAIRDEEIDWYRQEKSALHKAITSARLRLDAVRLIFKTKKMIQSAE